MNTRWQDKIIDQDYQGEGSWQSYHMIMALVIQWLGSLLDYLFYLVPKTGAIFLQPKIFYIFENRLTYMTYITY